MTRQLTPPQDCKKLWYIKNKERILKGQKDRYKKDEEFREAKKANAKRRRDSLPDVVKAEQEVYRNLNRAKINSKCAEWRRKNPVKVKLHSATARARKRSSTPKWLSKTQKSQIESFYWLAKDLECVTGIFIT